MTTTDQTTNTTTNILTDWQVHQHEATREGAAHVQQAISAFGKSRITDTVPSAIYATLAGLNNLVQAQAREAETALAKHAVESAVAEFNDPDFNVYDVASVLVDESIKGTPGEAGYCPIANFIKHRVDNAQARVGRGVVEVIVPGVAGKYQVALGKAAQEFVGRFDRGEFRELSTQARSYADQMSAYIKTQLGGPDFKINFGLGEPVVKYHYTAD